MSDQAPPTKHSHTESPPQSEQDGVADTDASPTDNEASKSSSPLDPGPSSDNVDDKSPEAQLDVETARQARRECLNMAARKNLAGSTFNRSNFPHLRWISLPAAIRPPLPQIYPNVYRADGTAAYGGDPANFGLAPASGAEAAPQLPHVDETDLPEPANIAECTGSCLQQAHELIAKIQAGEQRATGSLQREDTRPAFDMCEVCATMFDKRGVRKVAVAKMTACREYIRYNRVYWKLLEAEKTRDDDDREA